MPSPRHQRVGSMDAESLHSIDSEEVIEATGTIRQMTYDDRNHWSVLTQIYGSVWPRVLPYCVLNMVLTLLVFYFGKQFVFKETGHKFMALMVSFLVVNRVQIKYKQFMAARKHLEGCYKNCRELVQHMCVLTQDDKSEGATVWRHNVAYRTILLLRVAMAAIEFESQKQNPWDIPELTAKDQIEMEQSLKLKESFTGRSQGGGRRSLDATNLEGTDHYDAQEECFRAPMLLAYDLRKEIMEQRSGAYLERDFSHVNEELKLLDHVTGFNKAFEGLKQLVQVPFPFPLIQMLRAFLFVWVFTLPFVLCHESYRNPIDPLVVSFLTTFGFLGLEYVCMELDDPFGDDPNDFDDLGMAQLVFEDIYMSIYKVDGYQAAYRLRRKIVARMRRGSALANFKEDYTNSFTNIGDETIQFDRRQQFQQEGSGAAGTPFRLQASNTKKQGSKKKKKIRFSSPFSKHKDSKHKDQTGEASLEEV